MAKQVQIWDKVSPINGVPAEKIVNDWKDVDEVVLILDENNRVLEINDPAILKSNLKLNGNETALEIGQAWIKYEEEMQKQEQKNLQTSEQLQERISNLEDALLTIMDM